MIFYIQNTHIAKNGQLFNENFSEEKGMKKQIALKKNLDPVKYGRVHHSEDISICILFEF